MLSLIQKIENIKQQKHFKGIRIYTNNELDILKKTLFKSYSILAPKGRLVLITYHSLEDKVIKDFIKHTDKSIQFLRISLSKKNF
ncbi:MAG: hypothetical protein Ct9H90mP18_02540 [Gammaproteobacteria bacterium]|nr:MAG: hypothetical protein Ct9H90mP18_02540 [Gammaproteobacteria bacterium]